MEYVITAIIIYFVLQVVANLVRIWRGRGHRPSDDFFGRSRQNGHSEDRVARADRESPRFWGRDVEDVSWVDVEEPEDDANSAA